MKLFIIPVSCICLLFSMCGTNQPQNGTKQPDVKKPADNTTDKPDFRHYEKEGFITKDIFRVIVVQPFDSSTSDSDIEKQARNKAISSLKKHIVSVGLMPEANADAELINLINDSGKIMTIEDSDHA